MKKEKAVKKILCVFLALFFCVLSVRYSKVTISVFSYLALQSARSYLPVSSFGFEKEIDEKTTAESISETEAETEKKAEAETSAVTETTQKKEENKDKVLFIDARNYYTVVDRTLNEWSQWQMKNLNAIVWLYRGEIDKYKKLISQYIDAIDAMKLTVAANALILTKELPEDKISELKELIFKMETAPVSINNLDSLLDLSADLRKASDVSEGETIKYAETLDRDEMKALADKFGKKTYREYEKTIEIPAIKCYHGTQSKTHYYIIR